MSENQAEPFSPGGERRRSGQRFLRDQLPVLAATQDLVCVCRDGVVEEVNPAGARLLGAGDPKALSGHRFAMFVPGEYAGAVEDLLSLREIEHEPIPIHLKTLSGEDVEAELTVYPAREIGLGTVVVTARDISRQGRLARAAWDRESRFRLLVDCSMHMICCCVGERIVYVNRAGEEMLGAGENRIKGMALWDLLHPEYRAVLQGELEALLAERTVLPVPLRRLDGSTFDAQVMITPLPSRGCGREFMLEARDITAHNRAVAALRRINENLDRLVAERTRELERLAITDPLTGLFNRRHFIETAETEVRRAGRTGAPFSAIMLDIDHFKRINDTWGHSVGDEAIRAVARACAASAREIDCVGRLGGEEFAVLLPDTGLDEAVIAAERIRFAVKAIVVQAGGDEIRFTSSLGVAQYAEPDRDHEALLARADEALYRAKREGRDRVRTSSPP